MTTLPSLERGVIAFLRDLFDNGDDSSYSNMPIGTQLPRDIGQFFTRVTDLGGPQLGQPAWVFENLVQLDFYGGTDRFAEAEAEQMHNLARVAMPDLTTTECVVVRVSTTSLGRLPDTSFEPARPRFILQATIRWRPN